MIPQLVLAEVSYFINTRVKRAVGTKKAAETELALIDDITAGSFRVEPVAEQDRPPIASSLVVTAIFLSASPTPPSWSRPNAWAPQRSQPSTPDTSTP